MTLRISNNQYGKADVKILKLDRSTDPHTIIDMSVQITLKGDMEAAFVHGDNSKVVPTDTMKNTVYILGKRESFSSAEEFGKILTSHFVNTYGQISSAKVVIETNLWQPLTVNGGTATSAFSQNKSERLVTTVFYDGSHTISSGLAGLTILKSANSGFENYVMDEYTTLKPTADRIFATTLTATWKYIAETDYEGTMSGIRSTLLSIFANHDSKSVQETLYEMAKKVLEQFPAVDDINVSMPNEHKILFDLSKFGEENNLEILVPTPEPFGVIEATLSR
ncbi:MAG: factor-independent urate hydroxylase [Candidatus Kariarchaeaceae archaeon]|jgi:urate oxidase